jgi:hypothetical protein
MADEWLQKIASWVLTGKKEGKECQEEVGMEWT